MRFRRLLLTVGLTFSGWMFLTILSIPDSLSDAPDVVSPEMATANRSIARLMQDLDYNPGNPATADLRRLVSNNASDFATAFSLPNETDH